MRNSLCRHVARNTAVALCVGLLAGCSMFSSHDERYAPAPLTEYQAGVSVGQQWSVSLGSGSGYGFMPTVLDGYVYAAAPNGRVSKIDLASGRVIWQTDTGMNLSAGAGSDGRTTVAAAADGNVVALDENGREKWRVRATSEVAVPPVVGAGVVVVRSSDYRIQAFDANSGEALWDVQRPGPALALKASMQMRIVDDLLMAGLPNGRLIAIHAPTGSVQWEGTISTSQGATDLDRISDVVGAPQIMGPALCGVTYQGKMVCFDVSQGGVPMWEQRFSSSAGMAIDPGMVYAPDQRDVVHAFELASGREVWKQDGLRNRRLTAPAVVHQGIAVGDLDGFVHFLSRADGSLLGRVQVGGGAIVSPPVATDRGVLVQTGNGALVLVGVN
ncbi:MAG: outer membrane protein assembly factor BamB [Candidimonas sp.]|jgi:outer membrane protein assembly factor BamB